MAEANAAFLRGRAEVYRRMAANAQTRASAEDFVALAAAWDAEATALEAEQSSQPAPSILRRKPAGSAAQPKSGA